jgi:hypothetical protein
MATHTFVALTPEDFRVLMRLLEWWKRQPQGELPGELPRAFPAPDHYVALTPSGGIPGRSGTIPGSAECDIYKINTDEELEAVPDFSKTVYNVAQGTVAGSSYVDISRDKYGRWLAVSTGAGNDEAGSCGSTINGIDVENLALVSPSEMAHFLVTTTGGCIGRLPKQSC